MQSADNNHIRVEIAEETLLRLLAGGQVCAADFRCLDCKSKQCLWNLCLRSCANRRDKGFNEMLLQEVAGSLR
ncbi:hypothetical protein [uncultured Desulfosarcina sp.]|uniref:hypothetical protein n=1 Tax=uncultured Desulfosarcina sp. TaxID=218289 RepID=UPI0029C6B376|nr:hypothetical protein [uncultured Desulfosarcina sp.]